MPAYNHIINKADILYSAYLKIFCRNFFTPADFFSVKFSPSFLRKHFNKREKLPEKQPDYTYYFFRKKL
jgi:hypothetical protein